MVLTSALYVPVSVLPGNGHGTFQPPASYDSGGFFPTSMALADVNGDGKLDIVVSSEYATDIDSGCSADGSLGVLLGNGDGTFQPPVSFLSGGQYFPDKLAIFVALHDRHIRQVDCVFHRRIVENADGTLEELIASLVDGMIEVHS
jgi:hypothetical protein